MAFNINEFRSQMQGDGARPNLFEVTLPFPAFSLPGNAQRIVRSRAAADRADHPVHRGS